MPRLLLPTVFHNYTPARLLNTAKVLGGDVSKWQQEMYWPQAFVGGWRFALIRLGSITKAEPGNCYIDYQYERNSEIAPEFMYTGAYWYFRPAWSAFKQAEFVTEKLDGKKLLLPFVLDAENNDTGMADYYVEKRLRQFAERLYENTHKVCMIYTSKGWWSWPNIYAYDGRPDWAAALDLWVANYTIRTQPALPATWASKGWKFWQFTDRGDGLKYGVPQDPGAPPPKVDLNYFNGDIYDLNKYVSDYNNGTIPSYSQSFSWSPSASPSQEPQPDGYTAMIVTADVLNVRSGPSTSFPVLKQLKKGDVVEATNIGGSSAWIEFEPGRWSAVEYGTRRYMETID